MSLIYNKAKKSKAAADWVVYKNVQHQASMSAYSNATQQINVLLVATINSLGKLDDNNWIILTIILY